jgi:hypothetical protein
MTAPCTGSVIEAILEIGVIHFFAWIIYIQVLFDKGMYN